MSEFYMIIARENFFSKVWGMCLWYSFNIPLPSPVPSTGSGCKAAKQSHNPVTL